VQHHAAAHAAAHAGFQKRRIPGGLQLGHHTSARRNAEESCLFPSPNPPAGGDGTPAPDSPCLVGRSCGRPTPRPLHLAISTTYLAIAATPPYRSIEPSVLLRCSCTRKHLELSTASRLSTARARPPDVADRQWLLFSPLHGRDVLAVQALSRMQRRHWMPDAVSSKGKKGPLHAKIPRVPLDKLCFCLSSGNAWCSRPMASAVAPVSFAFCSFICLRLRDGSLVFLRQT
jgi:hypothetical protein